MSMTESEKYIEIIKSLDCENITSIVCEYNKTGCSDCSFMIAKNKAISALEEVQQLHAIGSVSEFMELKEKATAKKVIYRKQSYGTPWLCPNCEADQVKVEFMSKDGSEPKNKHSFCWKCGSCIDWSEGKE